MLASLGFHPQVQPGKAPGTAEVPLCACPFRKVAREEGIVSSPRHEFWPDNASYHDIPVAGIVGHRQVTEAYLAHVARSYSARLATFDQALAKLHAEVADLIPAS